MKEQGLLKRNTTSSRGDELRTKMASVGLTIQEAEQYEKELDLGKLVLAAYEK